MEHLALVGIGLAGLSILIIIGMNHIVGVHHAKKTLSHQMRERSVISCMYDLHAVLLLNQSADPRSICPLCSL